MAAAQAQSFVESVGVNTHFNYPGTPYTDHFPIIAEALIASGIRHIRDGIPNYSRPSVLVYLGQHGVKHSIGFPVNTSAGQIDSTLRANAPYVDYVEPENELDLRAGNPQWPDEWRAEQRLLFATVHGSTSYGTLPVVGPALGHFRNAALLGAVDANEDAGAMHYYPCNNHPGESSSAFSLPALTEIVRTVHVAKPIWTTEVGYEDDLPYAHCALSDAVIAKYVPRMIAEHWLAGQPRTYFYQFADMADRRGYNAMGLLDTESKPKPQYAAPKSMLTLLADPGPVFETTPLAYTLHGDLDGVHRLLLQKRDKSYVLLLWLEVPSWDASTQTPIVVPSRTVELSFGRKPKTVARYQYSDRWSLEKRHVYATRSIRIPVSDSISMLRIDS